MPTSIFIVLVQLIPDFVAKIKIFFSTNNHHENIVFSSDNMYKMSENV